MTRYLTLREAGERVATPAETVRYWIHTRRLRAFKPGRSVLVRESDLDAFVEANELGAVRGKRGRP